MKRKIVSAVGGAWGQRISLLVIICVVMWIFQPKFFGAGNAKSILLAIAIYGVMVCGMLFTVLVGGMDLSVASMGAFAAAIAFSIAQSNSFTTAGFFIGCGVALVACLAVGYLHGVFVTYFAIPAFVVTLATKFILYGIVPMITGGSYVYIPNTTGISTALGNANVIGIPMPVIIFAVCVAISAFVLGKTTYGRRLYAIGGNPGVSRLVGLNSNRNIKAAYMVSSAAAGLGGCILASMNGQVGQLTAIGYEGSVLMAMIVGGINLAGGEGGVPGAIFGALLVGIINNAMLLLGVSADYQKFVQGAVILAAISLSVVTKRRSAGLLEKRQVKTDA